MKKPSISQPQLLLLIGGACISLFLLMSFLSSRGEFAVGVNLNQEVLRVERHLGDVSILPARKFISRNLAGSDVLGVQDTLQTGADGDASVLGPNGERIHVSEGTSLYVLKEANQWILVVKKGDVQVADVGDGESAQSVTLAIKAHGTLFALADFEQDRQTRLAQPDFRNFARTNGIKIEKGSKLSTEVIDQTLQTHRGSFFKCYAMLLRKNPSLKGQSQVDFVIQASGRVQEVQIGFSSIRDPDFQKCLIESVKNIEFPGFSGESIHTAFPLRFE